MLTIQSKYFGEIEYEPEDTLTFPAGLFGFEEEHSFLLLPFEDSNGSMLCLQSTATPALAFVVLDPFVLRHDYAPVLQKTELDLFGVKDVQELAFYVLCAVKNPAADSTVNMKCPVVIHPEKREARQIIMEMDAYEMRHPLAEFGPGEEASPC